MPTVTFTPSETDLIEANRLWLRSELRTGGNLFFFACGAVIFAALGSHLASDAGFGPNGLAIGTGVLAWLLAVALILLGIDRLWLPLSTRKRLNQQKSLHCEVRAIWSDDEIVFETASGHSRHGWDEFQKWA